MTRTLVVIMTNAEYDSDMVLTHVNEIWEESPMIEQGQQFTSRKPERRDLVIHVAKTKEDT